MSECDHEIADDHSAMSPSGVRIWKCSHCGLSQPWGDEWVYNGNVECRKCHQARVDQVLCGVCVEGAGITVAELKP